MLLCLQDSGEWAYSAVVRVSVFKDIKYILIAESESVHSRGGALCEISRRHRSRMRLSPVNVNTRRDRRRNFDDR
jgi:hypothetical protein